jgi:hypothetical protein
MHKKIFSDDEEAGLVSFVHDNLIAPGLIFTDSDFREIAMSAFLTKYEDDGPDMPMFKCSAGFIAKLKAQHQLTSCTVYFKSRSAVTDEQRQDG